MQMYKRGQITVAQATLMLASLNFETLKLKKNNTFRVQMSNMHV